MLKIGDLAPTFSLQDQNGQAVSLEGTDGYIVLYFYPKDFTTGCTKQACLFRDASHAFAELQATIIGVSADSDESHKTFADRYQLPFSIVRDENRALAKAYGVTTLFGKWAKRTTFVIAPDKRITHVVWNELSMEAHIEGARAALAKAAP